jgi:hypothetical protein
MNVATPETRRFKETLERKQAELTHVLRNRDGIAIEKSADQMDEIQYAQERELATRNVDRESALLREVHAALQRVSPWQLWNLYGLPVGDRPKTPRGCAVGPPLYPLPGGGRSGWPGARGCE